MGALRKVDFQAASRNRANAADNIVRFRKSNNAIKTAGKAGQAFLKSIQPLSSAALKGLESRVKEVEKVAKGNWLTQQIDRIPWLKKLRLFASSTLDKTVGFFKDTATAIDKVLDKVPGWKFLKRLTGKGIELLTKFVSHPLVQKFLGALGLIANVFSIFSSISQWREVFKLNDRLEKFQNDVIVGFNRDYTKLINQVLPIKKEVAKLNKDIPQVNAKIKSLETVIPEIKKSNLKLAADIKAQNATLKGMQQGLALAVTANTMNLAIGSLVNKYQLTKLSQNVAPYSSQLPQIPILTKQVKELQTRPPVLTPPQIQEIARKVSTSPGAQGKPGAPGKPGVNGKDGKNGLPGSPGKNGLPGTNGLNGRDGAPGKQGINGKNGADGANGRDGLTSVIYQYLPGKNGKDGSPGRDAVMDADTKAKINAIFAETQGNKATQQAILTSAVTTQATTTTTQTQVGVIGNTINALVNLNQAIDRKLTSFVKWAGLDRVYNILIVITNLMTIASLLKGTTDMVVSAIETGWSLFGFGLKDSEGNQLSLSTAISGSLRQGLNQIFGTETVNDLEVQWVKNNRIYQAASAIAWNVISVVDQTRTLGEQTLGHLNKFANGAKDAGGVAEDAWVGHWSENPSAGPLGSAVQNLEQLSNKVAIAVMPIATAAGVKGELDQLEENKKTLATALVADDKKISDELAANKPKVPATLTNMRLGEVTKDAP